MSRTYKQISIWRVGAVYIEPSIKWSNIYIHDDLCSFTEQLKTKLPELNIELFKTNGLIIVLSIKKLFFVNT